MAPLRGWCRRGRRLAKKTPHSRWQTLTFVAALRVDRIDAPCVFDGPINGAPNCSHVAHRLNGKKQRKSNWLGEEDSNLH